MSIRGLKCTSPRKYRRIREILIRIDPNRPESHYANLSSAIFIDRARLFATTSKINTASRTSHSAMRTYVPDKSVVRPPKLFRECICMRIYML